MGRHGTLPIETLADISSNDWPRLLPSMVTFVPPKVGPLTG